MLRQHTSRGRPVLGAVAVLAVLGGVLAPATAHAQAIPAPPAPPTACMTMDTRVSDGYSGPGAGGEVLSVAPGVQSTLTNNTSPAGSPELDEPTDMAYLSNGNIVLTDSGAGTGIPQVVEVNRNTGARTLLSGLTSLSGPTVGSGPTLVWPTSVAVEASGDLLVGDQNPNTWAPRILRVNASTGDRVVLSGNGVGSGPALDAYTPMTIAILDGVIYLANGGQVMSVNSVNGDRTRVSGGSRGTGPTIVWPLSIADSPTANSLVVLDEMQPSGPGLGLGALITVDLATGDRVILSSNTLPSGGRQFDGPYDMAYDSCENVYYVLEPGYSPSTPPGRVLAVDGASGDRTLYTNFIGARNWSILINPVPPHSFPGGGGGDGDD